MFSVIGVALLSPPPPSAVGFLVSGCFSASVRCPPVSGLRQLPAALPASCRGCSRRGRRQRRPCCRQPQPWRRSWDGQKSDPLQINREGPTSRPSSAAAAAAVRLLWLTESATGHRRTLPLVDCSCRLVCPMCCFVMSAVPSCPVVARRTAWVPSG